MTPGQEELFRRAILGVLEANKTRFGLSTASIAVLVQPAGFEVTPDEVERQLIYLSDPAEAYVVSQSAPLAPKNKTWRITAKGTNQL